VCPGEERSGVVRSSDSFDCSLSRDRDINTSDWPPVGLPSSCGVCGVLFQILPKDDGWPSGVAMGLAPDS